MLFRRKKPDHEILEKSIYPIKDTENIIARFARSFPAIKKHRLEVFGYLIGLAEDRLTHLVIPRYVMGIKNDRKHEMTHIRDTRCRTQVMLATDEDTAELGILIMVSPQPTEKRHLKASFTFIPTNLLMLNRPLATFVPAANRAHLFPKVSADWTNDRHIVDVIKMSAHKKRTCIQNKENRWVSICFLPKPVLRVDAFVSAARSYPLNTFLLETLALNKFGRQLRKSKTKCYGRVHTHYGYDSWDLVSDPLIRALHRENKAFFELMSPVDAMSMIDSAQAAKEISAHRLQAEQILEGVIALDPRSLKIIGRSYFDRGTLKAEDEIRAFKKIAAASYNSRDIAANKNWFQYIRTKSKPERPEYTNPAAAPIFYEWDEWQEGPPH